MGRKRSPNRALTALTAQDSRSGAGPALRSPTARVRLSNGKVTVTDGPFIESKEVVGGLAIIKADSLREAIEHVKEFLSHAGDGECEVRQLYESEPGGACAGNS